MSHETKKVRIAGYALDDDLAEKGAVVGLGKNPDGSQRWIRVLPLNSTRYEARLNARRKQVSQATLRADPEIDLKYQRETLAELVLVEHGGFYEHGAFVESKPGVFELREGAEPLPNDYETRLAMLEDRNFYLDVTTAAAMKETFQQRTEEALGNSVRSSSGS